MYRVLSLQNIKIRQLNGMMLCNNEIKSRLSVKERICTSCKHIHTSFIRHQSTEDSPSIKPPRKRLRGAKKYAELLVVTDKSTKQMRAKIKKLTPEDLRFLASTNLNLSELYKLKGMMAVEPVNRVFVEHTYNNLSVIEDIPAIVESTSSTVEVPVISSISKTPSVLSSSESFNVKDEEYLEFVASHDKMTKEDDIEILQTTPAAANAFQPEIYEEELHETVTKEEVKDKLKKQNEIECKLEIISRTLPPYIEICSILNDTERGLNALWVYKYKTIRNKSLYPRLQNVNIFNAALKAAASEGSFPKLQEVIDYAKSIGVGFNMQSYAAILECLGRCDVDEHNEDIKYYCREAIGKGFTFNRILNKCVFLRDQKDHVLKAMTAYDRMYIPRYTPPVVQYNNNLLNHLNNEEKFRYEEKEVELETGIFTKKKMQDMITGQMETEKIGYVTIRNIENKGKPTEDVLRCRAAFREQLETWRSAALTAFRRELVPLAAMHRSTRLEPFMRSIPAEDIVNIIVDEAVLIAAGSETYSPTASTLHKALGHKVYSRFKVLRKKETGVLDKILKVHSNYCDDFVASRDKLEALPAGGRNLNPRQIWQWIEFQEKPNGSSIELDHQPWVPSVLVNIGKCLYSIIMRDLMIKTNTTTRIKKKEKEGRVRAFFTIFRHQGRIMKEEVKPHPILWKLYRGSAPETLTFPTYDVPMRCPPVPWSSLNVGGYLVTHPDFVRLPPTAMTQRQRLQEIPLAQLYPSFDALNQLAAVPWRVNKRIFDCIVEVFQRGGSAKLSVPENPAGLSPPVAPPGELDRQQKYAFFREKLQHRRRKGEMYSLWCDCLHRLSLAGHFKDDIFWLPHNMDFRGRVYPIPPHLNHLGSDLARSMLVFAEGRPLGPNGLDWLKIHLINLTGLKKRDSLEDRLAYANEIIDKILDSANNPLTGRMWWSTSDEPWQTLACCMEVAAAVGHPNPEEYVSHFPVHQDGSCNGLQHYAALGRDSAGGHSVNLTPAAKPQDVYSAVADLIEETRQRDAERGVEAAKILEGFVRRKVIKQTVMTTVYGVTRFGARLQIARQLKDIEEFPKESVWAGSNYLTGRTFDSLRTMFTSTREIQDWFTDCARFISSVCVENVEWVTPLGLPIVQPYSKYKYLSTNKYYEPFHMDKYEKPSVMKQKNAFPPNFIHSLDSCHMILTSLHAERAGITFVSVHDCYWTHPSTVHIMNKICREQFVTLHSEPILEDLSKFFINKYGHHSANLKGDGSVAEQEKKRLIKVLQTLPKKGDLKIKHVLDSVYFFS